ncbi:chloride channel protein, CIC family [Lebetimonas natsushimae]|uniref:Chloride channel protein, CIC family n=1 Tax=Lebetimonas natsushimae TaxID=1936991 RepID=A0A292YA12_9BACT|nr:chloride channel protein [Lebetimonas natsushimae]GAX87742.1 chloride channel protein, CIC family [Lebetimonas natsushimae]
MVNVLNLIVFSLTVGIVTGVFIVIYGLLTEFLKYILFLGDPFETINHLPVWYLYLIPTVAILIVNYLIKIDENVREYGVLEIAKAVEENKFFVSWKSLFLKIIASSISLASGFAVGNEGPSAAIGAMIANKFHFLFKLPKNLLKVALSIGSSSGIAAIFVSPITGIMFAIENIAYEFIRNFAGFLIFASLIAFTIAINFLEPIIFNYSAGKFLEYKYIISGILFIPFIAFFNFLYLSLKDKMLYFFDNLLNSYFFVYKNWILAIIGGFTIGTILLISPYAAFSGHELVTMLINNNLHIPLILLFLIIFLRIINISVSVYANAVGGIFMALMSLGALIGYGYAEVINHFTTLKIEPFYFAAIGGAIFMGVNMRLPLTALVMSLEITYDYNVIVPTGIIYVLVAFLMNLKFDIKKMHLRKK